MIAVIFQRLHSRLTEDVMKRTNVGLVGGGGENAFFGKVHWRATGVLAPEGFRIVAGVLRSEPAACVAAAEQWGIRGYGTAEEMLAKEPVLDYVVIATPNDMHFPVAKVCLAHQKPVLSEKPLTLTLQEARELQRLMGDYPLPFGVAYTYCGSWPFLLARAIVRSGKLGAVRYAEASYDQGWQARNLGIQQEWRQRRAKSGAFCCGGDIGSHGFQGIRWITGLDIAQVCVDARSHVDGRELDDTFRCFLRLSNNGDGMVTASQVLIGHKNDHQVRVCCADGTVEVGVEESEFVKVHLLKRGTRTYFRGEDYSEDELVADLLAQANWAKCLPSGHNEGFLHHLANIHLAFGESVHAWKAGEPWSAEKYPSLNDGVAGMRILHACAENAPSTTKWTLVPTS